MKNQKIEKRCVLRALFMALFLGMVLVLSGCGEKGTPPETQGDDTVVDSGTPTDPSIPSDPSDPSNVSGPEAFVQSIVLQVGRLDVVADGVKETTIRATVIDVEGNKITGKEVEFSTTSGTLVSTTAMTINGVASVILKSATNVGTATITASCDGYSGVTSVRFIPGPVDHMILTAATNNLVADGTSTSTIRATVFDAYDNVVADGETITFAVTSGSGSLVQVTAVTALGVATITYTASETPGTEIIRATSTNGKLETVDLILVGIPSTVSAVAVPDSIIADGATTSTVTATVLDENRDPVVGARVSFSKLYSDIPQGNLYSGSGSKVTSMFAGNNIATFTLGHDGNSNYAVWLWSEGGGREALLINEIGAVTGYETAEDLNGHYFLEVQADGDWTVKIDGDIQAVVSDVLATVMTDLAGDASYTYTSTTLKGGVDITASVDTYSDSVSITQRASDPVTLELYVTPTSIYANGATTSVVTAIVRDAYGNWVEDGLSVGFSATQGVILSEAKTDNGAAILVLQSSTMLGTADITATIGPASDTAEVVFEAIDMMNMTAEPSIIYALDENTATISVRLQDANGVAVQGETVEFSTDNGTLASASAMTDANGVVRVALASSSTEATATVTAAYGLIDETCIVTFVDKTPGTLAFTAAPNLVKPGGTSTLNATILDAKDNPVVGYEVTFEISTNNSGAALTVLTATTDSNGQAVVSYTAGSTSGADTVTVRTQHSLTENAGITVDAAAVVVKSITLETGSDSLVADGSTTATIRATIIDVDGNRVVGKNVEFSTTSGALVPTTATTINGVASVVLRSATNVGTATITGTCDGYSADTSVDFIPGSPASVIVSPIPANLTADGTSTSEIRVTVFDAHDNPIDGETLTFSANVGIFNSITMKTVNGVAKNVYTSPGSVPSGGTDTIIVETTGGVSAAAQVTLIGPSISSLTLSSDPLSIPADGASQATIFATVSVVGGGAVPDGTPVSFSLRTGGGSITPTATTAGGVAIATLTSGTSPETVVVRAEVGGRIAETEVVYTPGSVELTIIPNSLLGNGQEISRVTARVLDTGGLPKGGATVQFKVDDSRLGTLSPDSDVTDVNGEAQVDFTELGVGGTATITATWTDGGVDVAGSGSIEILPPPAFLEVAEGSPDPASINIKGTGGQSTSQIRFDVKDSRGNLVADGYRINFSIDSGPDGGEGIEPEFALTSSGTVSTILRSGSKSGPISIKATYFHNTDISTTSSQITINSGQPVGEEIGLFAEYLNISGLYIPNLEDGITLSAGDIYGNPVPDNTAISFKTYNTGGLMETANAPTSNGMASKILRSTSAPSPMQGFVSVTAEINDGGRSTHVTSIAVTPKPDNNYMYVGTNGGGVYKSSDDGSHWQNISRSSTIQGQNWIDPYVNDIVVDPDDANTLYAATGYLGKGNIYRSLDGGSSWNSNHTEEWHGILELDSAVLTVVCDDSASDYVWAGTDGLGVLRSEDDGPFTWGGTVTIPLPAPNPGDGREMTDLILGATAHTESWTVTYGIRGATTSELGFNGIGDGTMSDISATDVAKDETWTATCQGGFDATVNPIGDNNGHGTLTVVSAEAVDATYTVTCTDGTDDAKKFSVRSSVGGFLKVFDDITQNYEDGGLTFYVLETTLNDFAVGDSFTFTTQALSWQVEGSISGTMVSAATTGLPYTSDGGEVSFTITDGDSAPYEPGDVWRFRTTPWGEWRVSGTVSEVQIKRATTNLAYTSDHGEVSFLITEGATSFAALDAFTFDVTESGLGYGRVVRGLVKASGNGSSAVLYAATPTGVFKSVDGGTIWDPTGRFTGDNITTIAVHPVYDQVIYVGTRDAGVWTSTDGGGSWELQDAGDQDLGGGNQQGRHIKDLEVDRTNNTLYAITYFWGVDDPHSTGNLYMHGLVPATGAMTGDWTEVSQGLPPYSDDDPTRLAQHVLAVDDPMNPTALYIGGEGISLSKAVGGLDVATGPIWSPSQDGLTNLLMARMPILFSGICTMEIEHLYDEVTQLHTFTVYIQDVNGNPPIGGSTFKAQKEDVVLLDITYADAYTHAGTFRDPSDSSTDSPYVIVTPIGIDEEVVFEFTPINGDDAPGSSGSSQTVTYQ